jgi:hypothetical protein
MLHDEFLYFIEHQDELVTHYQGRYIVIKDRRVIGDYDSEWQAYVETQKAHALGTFLIQKCEAGRSAYSITLHPQLNPA